MSKSILVIDTPESCNRCDSCIIGSLVFCGMNGKKIEQEIMNESKKSENCPLKDFPNKKEIRNFCLGEKDFEQKGYQQGYNDCIDEILKGDGAE